MRQPPFVSPQPDEFRASPRSKTSDVVDRADYLDSG
jgi:hypothetical protein